MAERNIIMAKGYPAQVEAIKIAPKAVSKFAIQAYPLKPSILSMPLITPKSPWYIHRQVFADTIEGTVHGIKIMTRKILTPGKSAFITMAVIIPKINRKRTEPEIQIRVFFIITGTSDLEKALTKLFMPLNLSVKRGRTMSEKLKAIV
jgi:hypothetical protein